MPLIITPEADGGLKFTIAPGAEFRQPAAPEFVRMLEPTLIMQGSAANVADLADKLIQFQQDDNLSDAGRERKVAPLRAEAIKVVADAWAGISSYEAHIDKLEAALIKLPELDPTHSAAAVEDREVRDWWRALPAQDRLKLLERIDNESGHERLMIALLRSPVPQMQLDHEVEIVRGVWRRSARLNDPVAAERVDSGRIAIDWARRGAAQLGAVGMRALGIERDMALQTIVASDDQRTLSGFGVFGFSEADVVRQQRVHEMRTRLAS